MVIFFMAEFAFVLGISFTRRPSPVELVASTLLKKIIKELIVICYKFFTNSGALIYAPSYILCEYRQ